MSTTPTRSRNSSNILERSFNRRARRRPCIYVLAGTNGAGNSKGDGSIDFCLRMLDEAAVALAPGRAFGENGENYVRIALVENEQRLRQAMRNLERALVPRKPKGPRKAAKV